MFTEFNLTPFINKDLASRPLVVIYTISTKVLIGESLLTEYLLVSHKSSYNRWKKDKTQHIYTFNPYIAA